MKTIQKDQNRKKRFAGAAAILLAITLLLAGTFAWYGSTNAVNEFDRSNDYEAVLHDDYDGSDSDATEYDKKVYVENTGSAEIYVRVRLDEYMEIDGVSLKTGALRYDSSGNLAYQTWCTHIPVEDPSSDVCECGEGFHTYWSWEMGGGTYSYLPAQYDPNYIPNGGTQTLYQYDPNTYADNWSGLSQREDTNKGNACNVITLEEYKLLPNKEDFVGWVFDTSTENGTPGWAYWTEVLKPGEATGLLLSEVHLEAEAGEESYYAINIEMEAVSLIDLPAWTLGHETVAGELKDMASTEIREMLWRISGSAPQDAQLNSEILTLIQNARTANGGVLVNAAGEYPEVTIGDSDWLILDYNDSTKEVELLSKQMIATEPYHNVKGNYPTWELSYIRNKFLDDYFNNQLHETVKNRTVRVEKETLLAYNKTDTGTTEDWIYLLNKEEVNRYWPNENVSQRIGDYAGSTTSGWWLRDPMQHANSTYNQQSAAVVGISNGKISGFGVWAGTLGSASNISVRPALTIALY